MADPVAAKSTMLTTYMANHPDTLVAYVAHYTNSVNVAKATMQSIDSQGMDMTYVLKGSSASHSTRIPFDPPLAGYEEVRPRLLAMKVDAEETLGMSKNPIITEFSMPWKRFIYGPTPLQIALMTITLSGSAIMEAVREFVGWRAIKMAWAFVFILHPLESLYVAHLLKKHQTPFPLSVLWWAGTLLFGAPFLLQYRSLVKQARIDSIKKVT